MDVDKKKLVPRSKESTIQELGVEQYKLAFEQYKLLVDSIDKINDTRESSNNFWIGANSACVSILAYLRDTQSIQYGHKPFLLVALIIIGVIFTVSWMSYLRKIKQSIELRSEYLVGLEKNFPVPVFGRIFASPSESQSQTVLAALTRREMLVPCIFFVSYLIFGVLLYFFPQEVVAAKP
ncbi:MAG: hypothetical protein K0R52_210 [Alphaproteobacteria bacterium]|jgi:hypothetical protein|nr:hypothetical protein [Alphaproteobacteria bacterium]